MAEPAAAITLDGRLDEAFWKTAPAIELTQQDPRPGEDTPYHTTVRVAVTEQTIYFAFECFDPEPGRIAIHTMNRDGEFDGDDSVGIVLDTYRDGRTGYYFRVNASGARLDGLIAGLEEPSLDWDGLWDARVARTANGWTVEMELPVRTVSFQNGSSEWAANFERFVPRDRTVLRWTSPTLDSLFFDLSRAGTIRGLHGLKQGAGLDIGPYSALRMPNRFQEGGRSLHGAVGADITYRLLPQFSVMLTANTDFAEAEVDARQINLTRFSLYFPERRAFFLEGSNLFQFGFGLEELFIPFFSRHIGLVEGEAVPIDVGVKAGGRLGKWSIGVLSVRTRDTRLSSGSAVSPASYLVSRISFDVTPSLRLGSIVTAGGRENNGRGDLAGFDGLWRTSRFLGNKNLLAGGWVARSSGAGATAKRSGYGLKVDYPNDRWNCSASAHRFGELLEPGLGFLPRPGVRREDAACDFRPRPSKAGPLRAIRQAFVENRYHQVTNHRGEVESQHYEIAPYNVQFESGDRFDFSWTQSHERLPQPFEISRDVAFAVGAYRFHRFRAEAESSRHRQTGGGATAIWGGFYSGRLTQYLTYLRHTGRGGRWEMNAEGEWNRGTFPEGQFTQRLVRVGAAVAFSPNAIIANTLQYDSESQSTANNMRLRWIIRPGKELIVVWNRGWRHWMEEMRRQRITPESEAIVMKIRWTLRP